MDDPPAILFAYGNWELLNQPTFALLASHTVSKQGLAVLESLAQGFLEQGWVPIASVNQPAYQRLALCAAREGAPLISGCWIGACCRRSERTCVGSLWRWRESGRRSLTPSGRWRSARSAHTMAG